MVHLYYYFGAKPNSQFPKGAVGGRYSSIATEAREQEVSDQLLRGQVYCYFDSALNERDTLLVRGRTTSAPGPHHSKKVRLDRSCRS
jgi:hypothetical protein